MYVFFFLLTDCVRIDPFDQEKGASAGAGLEFIHFDLVWLGLYITINPKKKKHSS